MVSSQTDCHAMQLRLPWHWLSLDMRSGSRACISQQGVAGSCAAGPDMQVEPTQLTARRWS